MKFATNEVPLMGGRVGIGRFFIEVFDEEERLLDNVSYSRIPITVELSMVPWPVKYGLAAIKKVVATANIWGLVLRRTLVVCPGVMRRISVSNGLI